MANRTKSFFDEDNVKRPQHWQRRPNRQPLSETSNNVSTVKPPIPATSQSKARLQTFNFKPDPAEKTLLEQQENENGLERKGGMPQDATLVRPESEEDGGGLGAAAEMDNKHGEVDSQAPQLPQAQTYPCTPGTRLTIEDLVGGHSNASKLAGPPNPTPEDHIGWIPYSSTLTSDRKRRRARSSSPSCPNTSSQRHEALASYNGVAAHEDVPSPEIDSILGLLPRTGNGTERENNAKPSGLERTMFAASPRTSDTPAKSAGLRRWASTGNDWPISRCKRRRPNVRTDISVWRNDQLKEQSNKSKVATMLDRVEETLASQKLSISEARVGGPSSSSPLPEVSAGAVTGELSPVSPLHFKQDPCARHVQPSKASALATTHLKVTTSILCADENKSPRAKEQQDMPGNPDVSEFAPLHLRSKAPLPAYKRPAIVRAPSNNPQQQWRTTVTPMSVQGPANEDLTEFVDDLELTAEDLDELMVEQPPLHQRQLHQIPQHPNPPAQQRLDRSSCLVEGARTDALAGPAGHQADVDDLHDEFDCDDIGEILLEREGQHKSAAGGNKRAIELGNEEFSCDDLNDITLLEDHHVLRDDRVEDDDDEFGSGDLDEFGLAEAEANATQALRILLQKRRRRNSIRPLKHVSPTNASNRLPRVEAGRPKNSLQRYVVKRITSGQYTNNKGHLCPERVLSAEDERTRTIVAITVRGSWINTALRVKDVVHIVPQRRSAPPDHVDLPGQIMVSDIESSPLLIVHPDRMLSALPVADSFECIRRAVLQQRIKATGETTKALVYGKVLHEVFQQALSANSWDDAFLADLVDRTVSNHLEGLWVLGMRNPVLAVEEVKAKMGELASWARIFVAETPSEVSLVSDRNGEKVWMSISKLIAIEEHIWSPQYGLKGNIDATVQATFRDHPREPSKRLLLPFEVKTGRTTQSASHRAQTALYTLLLSDRYDVSVQAGLLYYLESSSMSRIAPPAVEIRQMVQQRNRLAAYVHGARHPRSGMDTVKVSLQSQEIEDSGLPAMLKDTFKCSRCFAQQSCFTYHTLVEGGDASTAGMIDDGKKNHSAVWREAVGHLRPVPSNAAQEAKLKEWFAKWDRLLTLEERDSKAQSKELWTMSSAEREAVGRCFGGLALADDQWSTSTGATGINKDGIEGGPASITRFTYRFIESRPVPGHSFVEGTQLVVGEPVVVSSEAGEWALANGYVLAASKHDITVGVDRKIGNARVRAMAFDAETNQAFEGTMTVGDDKTFVELGPSEAPVLYRLDKDEFSNGLALVRNNLVTLMSSHPIHTKLRSQIIFSSSPFFSNMHTSPLPASQLGEMNEDQLAAVDKVLRAQDYALLLGMPGTGKTTTIAHLIRAFLAEEKSILLTAFTHTAVDNILLKLRDIVPPKSILRLGAQAKFNSQVLEFCQLASTKRGSIDEIEDAYMGCRIVATTCMGTNHVLFSRRAFDVCIVDEASQITLPISLGPLLHARKFVLVGDHHQLPPLVQNAEALAGGLEVSLFRQLCEEHPEAVATLGKQYRMCEDIMSLSNTLIYDGKLQCGNNAVAQRSLNLKIPTALSVFHSPGYSCPRITAPTDNQHCWLSTLTDPSRKVLFANTDPAGPLAHETLTTGAKITNSFEATLIAYLVLAFLALGVPAKEIGVITLYRSQLSLLRTLFKLAGITPEIEIDSADRYQGRDKECTILSMVRSNEAGIVGSLLEDWRRVNVALTRARSKIVVLGSRKTLRNNGLLRRFLDLVDGRGWSVDLPADAVACHRFEGLGSQQGVEVFGTGLENASLVEAEAKETPSTSHLRPSQIRQSPSKILAVSTSAGNRSPSKRGAETLKRPAKVVDGRASQASRTARSSLAQAQEDFEIFEDWLDSED